MAKLIWSIETVQGNVTKDSPILTDPNMQRFLDWIWYAYPQFLPDGVTPKPRNNANEADAFREWAAFDWQFVKERVLDYERSAAAQAARDSIAGIE
jgi:hypothetical protein